jgi:phosphoribosyl 1,2-cyclic phosphate phosphodiesterase
VLGTSATGVPSFYCGCKACEEARSEPRAARGCCGLAVRSCAKDAAKDVAQTVTLIDSSPDLRSQLVRERIDDVERILFTHEHFDHIGGLGHLEYYVRLKRKRALPLYAGDETLDVIRQQFGFMSDAVELHRNAPWQQLTFENVSYTALPATHSKGAVGFVIAAVDGNGPAVAYFPDTATLLPQTAERLHGIDILLLDASFNGNNWMPHSHHSIDQAIATAQELKAGRCYLTHLSMHYDLPITLAELEQKLAPYEGRILPAHDGLTIAL